MTWPPLVESRLPVGSSARRISGLLINARATATRCCCPPDSSEGLCAAAIHQPDKFQGMCRPLGALAAGNAVETQREGNVIDCGKAGNQVERLENHADLDSPVSGQRVFVHFTDLLAVDFDFPGCRLDQSADHMQERALARTGGAKDGDESLSGYFQVHPVQGVDYGLPHAVALPQSSAANK